LSAFFSQEAERRTKRTKERHAEQRVPLGLGAAAEERQRVRTRQAGVLPSEIVHFITQCKNAATHACMNQRQSQTFQRESPKREERKIFFFSLSLFFSQHNVWALFSKGKGLVPSVSIRAACASHWHH
jgi:hypothetical protein